MCVCVDNNGKINRTRARSSCARDIVNQSRSRIQMKMSFCQRAAVSAAARVHEYSAQICHGMDVNHVHFSIRSV